MSDLVERLRVAAALNGSELADEAADRIEALENWQRLHAGDTLSLNNEVEQCRLEIEQLGRELEELARRRPEPTPDKINEAFKRATEV
jgi:phage shock protein A